MTQGLQEIFGMLMMQRVELPFKTKEAEDEAAKINKEAAKFGLRTFRAAYDWAFRPFAKSGKANDTYKEKPIGFQSGDLVRIFRTVTDGDVLWSGTVDLDCRKYHHGLQRGMSDKKWQEMFYTELPARLERKDGTVIFGALMPFCETGTEGVIWSVQAYGKVGYAGLECLKDGDKLTVYSNVRDGDVEWEGPLKFGPEKVEKVGWNEIMRQSLHIPTEEWLQLHFENRPVAVRLQSPDAP